LVPAGGDGDRSSRTGNPLWCARFGKAGLHDATAPAMMNDLISVIITTYNREDALAAVLRGLAHQSERNFEIIVADDGSRPATRETVQTKVAASPVPIVHVWQEDRGFRAGEARNRAIAASAGTYCVFLDGDCIPRPGFVAAHRRLAEPGWFVTGNRVLLSSACTEQVLAQGLAPEHWGVGTWLALRLRGDVNRVMPLLPLPLGALRKVRPRAWRGARSCNLGVWRTDLDRIDGFDARYSGWGLEDSDLLIRLIRSGVRRKDGNFATGVWHLWHAEHDRSMLPENARRLDEVAHGNRLRASEGISALRQPATPVPAQPAGHIP
jgi:glycosyltransferase involved in cell wall biosynthesis